MSKGKLFRDALKRGMVAAPGCFDCITARSIERAGFEAAYMTGAGTAASLGYPDYGLVTMTEMAANAGRIATAIKLPWQPGSGSSRSRVATEKVRPPSRLNATARPGCLR